MEIVYTQLQEINIALLLLAAWAGFSLGPVIMGALEERVGFFARGPRLTALCAMVLVGIVVYGAAAWVGNDGHGEWHAIAAAGFAGRARWLEPIVGKLLRRKADGE